jgi:FkbM family methyltransferase
VLDVGASDGEYGRSLRHGGYRGSVLSFEPLPAAYAKLEMVAAEHPPWHVAPRAAVGSRDGSIDINVAGNSVSSSILSMRESHVQAEPDSRIIGVEKVPMIRLDSFSHPALNNPGAILLKIDTQGYELEVLDGAQRLLDRVTGVQVELSLASLYEGQPLYRSVLDWLSDRGFNLWGLMPGFVEPVSGRLLQCDGLLFRD